MYSTRWRLYFPHGAPTILEEAALAELTLHSTVGGPNLCTGGGAYASSFYGGTPAQAFDGDTHTYWRSALPGLAPHWLEYTLPVGAAVVQYSITTVRAVETSANTPLSWYLQYYDTPSGTWANADAQTVPGWFPEQMRSYIIALPATEITFVTSGTPVTTETHQLTATTSGDSSFNPVRDSLVKASLRLVGAYNSNDDPTPGQMVDATEAINLMLHSWQVDGFLWLQKFALLTLVPGQASYAIGSGSTDTCVYSDGGSASRPTRITSACYRNSSGFDLPMTAISRNDYMALSNKSTPGRPVEYFYDPQQVKGTLTVWPVPTEAATLFLTMDRGIYDLVNDTDTVDVPQEWLRAIKWGGACEIAPEYAVPAGELVNLENRYAAIRQALADYDQESVDINVQRGYR